MSNTKSLLLFFSLLFSLSLSVYSDLQVKKPPPPPLQPITPVGKPPASPQPVVTPPSQRPVKPPSPSNKPPSPPTTQPPPPVMPKDCARLCGIRCGSHGRPNVCIRACNTCCLRCKCVPPGTYGNREKCGKCYINMTTHGGRPKCP
ncbi:hypothetical protein AALP_AA5G051700 [Arabis alpina]|uniref:Gibberellin-regulated family protein n=1 Tax=Arabis alpina TaxID=50452 RepID=A0A087GV22_ARAAL|nr:hypothetical protein AALP_AA5G051700 [Arabis alpina]